MDKIPFDLEAFKAGAVALNREGKERFYAVVNGQGCAVDAKGTVASSHVGLMRQMYTMKPTESDGWIPHDGGDCPIPWAKTDEFMIRYRVQEDLCEGEYVGTRDAIHYPWGRNSGHADAIVAYRLTDGWIPVKGDGTIPEAIRGAKEMEWGYRLRWGRVLMATKPVEEYENRFWIFSDVNNDCVALRRVKKEEKPVIVGIDMAAGKDRSIEVVYKDGKPVGYQEIETPQQRLNREALASFQASDRGKEFRAKLGHTGAPVPAMGKDAIDAAIFAALCESFKGEKK